MTGSTAGAAARLSPRYWPPARLPATYEMALDGGSSAASLEGYLGPCGMTAAALAARGAGAGVTLAVALVTAAAAASTGVMTG